MAFARTWTGFEQGPVNIGCLLGRGALSITPGHEALYIKSNELPYKKNSRNPFYSLLTFKKVQIGLPLHSEREE